MIISSFQKIQSKDLTEQILEVNIRLKITQPKNNSLHYLIDPIFRNLNRLSVISFKNLENDLGRGHYDKYFVSLVEIKDFNVLINNKAFLINP